MRAVACRAHASKILVALTLGLWQRNVLDRRWRLCLEQLRSAPRWRDAHRRAHRIL